MVKFNIKSMHYLVLFAGKTRDSAGWRNCQVLVILTKARAFLSTTTESSCFKRPGVYPGLLQKCVLYDVTAGRMVGGGALSALHTVCTVLVAGL